MVRLSGMSFLGEGVKKAYLQGSAPASPIPNLPEDCGSFEEEAKYLGGGMFIPNQARITLTKLICQFNSDSGCLEEPSRLIEGK